MAAILSLTGEGRAELNQVPGRCGQALHGRRPRRREGQAAAGSTRQANRALTLPTNLRAADPARTEDGLSDGMGAGSPREERGAHAQRRRETQAALRRIPCVPSYQLCPPLPSIPFSCVGRGAGGAAPGKQRKRKGQEEDGETQRKKKAKGKAKPEPGPKRKKKRGKVDPNATLAKG